MADTFGFMSGSSYDASGNPLNQTATTELQNLGVPQFNGYVAPRAAALDSIKTDLNNYQSDAFNTPDPSTTRASSSITDSITGEQTNYDTLAKEYSALTDKLKALGSPNYQQTFNDLTTQQGIPQINTDLASTDKTIRELPYVNRMNSGNAGAETETQLGADTTQKGIPLEIQQANLLDRLKLAQDFVDNSLKFKQMDADQARQSLTDAISTAAQAINMSQSHLSTLNTLQQQQQQQQQVAEQFAFDNRVNQPFYDIGGTIYRTSDGKAYSTPQQFFADGGSQDFSNVQTVTQQSKPLEVSAGASLYDPATGQLIATAPKTKAASGGGSSGGTGTSGKYTAADATTEIMGEWNPPPETKKPGYIQGNGKIASVDYQRAKQWWESHGLSATAFDNQFGYLIDKTSSNWRSDYGYGSN